MDPLALAAARALSRGDALGALERVALRSDPAALALRGIAMAQLGDLARARELLRAAQRAFGKREAWARARACVAEAEVALASRDLSGSTRSLTAAITVLEAHGDRQNAAHARLLIARRQLLLGRLAEAQSTLAEARVTGLAATTAAHGELLRAELCLRVLDVEQGSAALERALAAAREAGVSALLAEVDEARTALRRPAALLVSARGEEALDLAAVARVLRADALVIDGSRRRVLLGGAERSLARRPLLFALLRALGRAWPESAPRELLIERAFGARRPNESDRARLRVEVGRLRALLRGWARIEATRDGFRLLPSGAREVRLIAPPIAGERASLLALLSDGMPWSTAGLSLALGESQRTIQRALQDLGSSGQVRSIARGRARRWLSPPLVEFTTILLLPLAPPLT